MIPIRTWLVLAMTVVAFPACSHVQGDSTSANAASANVATGNAEPTDTGRPASAGTGALLALLASLPPPAPTPAAAATQFTWLGDEHGSAGKLSAGLDALMAAELSAFGQRQLHSVQSQASVPAASLAANPAAAAAIASKLQSMGQAQQLAYAMQLGRQMNRQMAGEISGSEQAALALAQANLAESRQQVELLTMQLAAQQSAADADKADIERQAAAAHDSIQSGMLAAIDRVPVQSRPDGSGKCLNRPDALTVQALVMQAADRHVAAAQDELRKAAGWSSKLRSALTTYARGIDGVVAGIPPGLMHGLTGAARAQLEAQLDSLHGESAVFQPYWHGVRDFDFAAAAELRIRDHLAVNGGVHLPFPLCN